MARWCASAIMRACSAIVWGLAVVGPIGMGIAIEGKDTRTGTAVCVVVVVVTTYPFLAFLRPRLARRLRPAAEAFLTIVVAMAKALSGESP